jgi:hypothetical protein
LPGEEGEEEEEGCDAQVLFPEAPEEEGREEIELFFDAEAPEVEEGFSGGLDVEVTGFVPEEEVGEEGGAAGGVFAEGFVVVGEEGEPSEGERGGQDEEESGEDAADAAGVEAEEGEAAVLEAVHEEAADEKAGDDEEEIDADESALEPAGEEVIAEDGKDGDRAQSVNVRAIG